MKKSKVRCLVAVVAISVSMVTAGCANLGPTVKSLRATIKAMRVDDYEGGRVIYSTSATINSRLLTAKIERLKMAENNASVALKEDIPFPTLLKLEKGKSSE